MKLEANYINYGIYVDRKQAFIISLNHIIHEELMQEDIKENEDNNDSASGSDDVNRQTHIQNSRNENLKKYCKSIISKLENPHSILIFGPSGSKYQLQKEIRDSKSLKNVKEELIVTDVMEKEAALRFVKDHFATITAGQQTFTVARKW